MGRKPQATEFTTEVIVIGAGAAGLSLAEHLNAAGISNIVLEARGRIGGRIKSQGYPWGRTPLQLALGAEFMHTYPETGNVWNHLISRGDFTVDDIGTDGQTMIGNKLLHDKNDRPPKSAGMILELEAGIRKYFRAGGTDTNVRTFLESHPLMSVPDDDHMVLLEATLANEYGEDMRHLSLQTILEPDSYTSPNKRLHEGFGELVNVLGENQTIRMNTAVESIRWKSGRALVRTTQGSVLSAPQCAITVPIGMLQKNKPQFIPPLPGEKQRAIGQILPGRVTKVILKFRKRFWNAQMRFLRGGQQQLSWPPALHHDSDAPFLTALVGGEQADILADLGGGQAARVVANEIMNMYGITNPKDLFVEGQIAAWHRKPFSMTGYSSLAIGADKKVRETLRAPVDNTLFFAGEATSTKHPATVNGAIETGIQAAEEIILSRSRR